VQFEYSSGCREVMDTTKRINAHFHSFSKFIYYLIEINKINKDLRSNKYSINIKTTGE